MDKVQASRRLECNAHGVNNRDSNSCCYANSVMNLIESVSCRNQSELQDSSCTPIGLYKVQNMLRKCKKTARGLDDVPYWFFCECWMLVAPLLHICSICLLVLVVLLCIGKNRLFLPYLKQLNCRLCLTFVLLLLLQFCLNYLNDVLFIFMFFPIFLSQTCRINLRIVLPVLLLLPWLILSIILHTC